MGVSYQQFRSSKLITHYDRAKASLEACCTLLENLSIYWYSAEAMARLGRKALHQIEEVKPGSSRYGQESRQQTAPDHSPVVLACHPEPTASASITPMLECSDDRRSLNDAPLSNAAASLEMNPMVAPLAGRPMAGFQPSAADGFADIDMLFGDFLDLSLPTNFWDPVFYAEEQGGA